MPDRTPGTSHAIVAAGLSLLLLGVVVAGVSSRFLYGVPLNEKPVELLVLLLALLGLVFMLLAGRIVARGLTVRLFGFLLGVGVLLRLAMLLSEPIMETDFYRYLWDGAVVAQGVNPYTPVPAEVMKAEGALADLGADSGVVVGRVNHPELRTIYPPVAQAFFALSHVVSPWSLTAWRGVLLVADVATLALLLAVLAAAGLPREYALLYWLNPLVLKEIHNAAHMDVLLAPFLLGALLLAQRGRLNLGVVCLAAATGLKVWPVLLLPLLLRAGAPTWKRTIVPVSLFLALVGIMQVPVLLAGLDSTSGFTAYASRWEMNNSVSLILIGFARWLAAFDWVPLSGRAISSGLSILILGLGVLLSIRRPVAGIEDLAGRALVVVALLFLISPTQFPWYAIWFLPLLAIRPHPALLLYAVTLPLYYLRFRYADIGLASIFDYGIVWIEHGPILLLLVAAKWKPEWLTFQPGSLLTPARLPNQVGALEARS